MTSAALLLFRLCLVVLALCWAALGQDAMWWFLAPGWHSPPLHAEPATEHSGSQRMRLSTRL